MANLSLRGLDEPTLNRIRFSARRRKVSVNRLIIDTLREQYAGGKLRDDGLRALAGSWTKKEADEFDAGVAPFERIDAALWAAEPSSRYRVKRLKPRAAGK